MAPTDHAPSEFVRIQAFALLDLAARLDGSMASALGSTLDVMQEAISAQRPIILTGIGKSGIIAQKIAATLRSTGCPAHFLHPAEAIHGDLGILASGDVVLALSHSGETEELLRLLPTFQRLSIQLITITSCAESTLAAASLIVLDSSINADNTTSSGDAQPCTSNLAPTASTTVMLALGDAIALELAQRTGFQAQHFADLHPGGKLGRRLTRLRDLMHTGDAIPRVSPSTPMPDVIYEMSRKQLGIATVLAPDDALLGIISDGDLRRLLERDGPNALHHTAAEIMNRRPATIDGAAFATTALDLMETRKITSLIVTNPAGIAEGVVHLHDLWALLLP